MNLNLKIEYADAEKAVRELNASQLIQQVKAGVSPAGLTLSRPNITIRPEPTVVSQRREIIWNLSLQIANSDEDDLEEFEEVVNALFDGAQAAAGQAMSAASGLPLSGRDVLLTIGRTMGRVSKALEGESATRTLQIDALPVKFENRLGRDVTLSASLFIEALWITDDPDDDGNKAWIEVETFRIGTYVDRRSSPNQWDASAWDPRAAAPSGHQGRSFMEPHGEDDLVGAFKTQPGSNPRPEIIGVTFRPISEDETDVSATVSINARADDTVIVLVYRLRLVLIADTPAIELGANITESVREMIEAAVEQIEDAFDFFGRSGAEAKEETKEEGSTERKGSKKTKKQ